MNYPLPVWKTWNTTKTHILSHSTENYPFKIFFPSFHFPWAQPLFLHESPNYLISLPDWILYTPNFPTFFYLYICSDGKLKKVFDPKKIQLNNLHILLHLTIFPIKIIFDHFLFFFAFSFFAFFSAASILSFASIALCSSTAFLFISAARSISAVISSWKMSSKKVWKWRFANSFNLNYTWYGGIFHIKKYISFVNDECREIFFFLRETKNFLY